MKFSPLAIFVFSLAGLAQQAAQPVAPPSTGFPGLDHYRASRIAIYTSDYGELARYRDANAALKPPAPGEKRVIFFGDSITDMWKLADSFPGESYINRGIGGQTTSQMLVRFRQDVIDLQPKVVVILAGTNDIAGNTGPISDKDIEANYASIAELARTHNIRVIWSSILPVHNYTPQSQELFAQRSRERILALNRWLKDYCAANDLVYIDYFSAVVDDKGLLRRELASDGLHPNKAGYAIMAPLAEKAVNEAVGGSPKGSLLQEHQVANESNISITLKHNSERERETEQQLRRLLNTYDLRNYTFTREIVIDEQAIPHSHPVLTLHTRHLNSDDQLLSTYVHEQLHWYLSEHSQQTRSAETDLHKIYPKVPVGGRDGANDEESTYLHLVDCYLEMQADRELIGRARATAVMNFWAGDHYRWIYETVVQDESKIANVLNQHQLGISNAQLSAHP